MLCDSHAVFRCAFVAEREREEEEESLFLSNARMCDENLCISFFLLAKNEKFGREKDTNADVVLNRFSDENGILLRETTVLRCHRTRNRVLFASRRRVCASISTRFRESWIFSFLGLKGLWLEGLVSSFNLMF